MSTSQNFQPIVETKETPECLILRVPLPGFAKENVRAIYDPRDPKRVRIVGEPPGTKNNLKRIEIEYKVPDNCDGCRIEGKFEEGYVKITMPKKIISWISPKEPKQEVAAKIEGQGQTLADKVPDNSDVERIEGRIEGGIINITMPKKFISWVSLKEEPKQIQDAAAKSPTSTPPNPTTGVKPIAQEGISQEPKLTTESPRQADKKKVEILASPQAKGESKIPAEKKEMNGEGGNVDEGNRGKMKELTGKGIKAEVASASEAVTKLANRFEEEDKHKLMYMGVAILVTALGVYASYKLRS